MKNSIGAHLAAVACLILGCSDDGGSDSADGSGGASTGGTTAIGTGGTPASGGSPSGGTSTALGTGGSTGGASSSAGLSGGTGGAATGGVSTGGTGLGSGGRTSSGTGGLSGLGGTGGAGTGGSTLGGSGSGGLVTGGTVEPGGVGGTGGGASPTGGQSGQGLGTGGSSLSAGGAGGSDPGAGGTSDSGGTSAGGAAPSDGGAAGDPSTGGTPSGDATIVPDPSWACGLPDGAPPPTLGEPVFTATIELGEIHDVGETQYGSRRFLDITGGSFTGDRITGTFVTGGLDYELTLSNGSIELEQINILKTDDGTHIYVRTCGFAPAGDDTVRIVWDFEAPTSGAHAWLNQGTYVGTRTVDEASGTMALTVYDVSGVTPAEPTIQLEDPADKPDQPWDCNQVSGSGGAEVFSEIVTLGGTITINGAKRGSRNIIPITGGTVSGRLTGRIVPGGADYQLAPSGGTNTLDARYALQADNDEYIVVRNCGPMGGMVPWFEAPVDGEFAFLNENTYVSDNPAGATGGVRITFRETQ